MSSLQGSQDTLASSEEELETTRPEFQELSQCDSEGMFSFRRKFGCNYLPVSGHGIVIFFVWFWRLEIILLNDFFLAADVWFRKLAMV